MPIFRLVRHRLQSDLTVRSLRAQGAVLGHGVRFIGRPIVELAPSSMLQVGARTRIISVTSRTPLGVNHAVVLRTLLPGAIISLGDDVGVSGGSICSAVNVAIGNGTMLGANVTVVDTDFHPIDGRQRRYAPLPEPIAEDAVVIGSNVFIGTGAIILSGTHLGDDCVVGAGAVVKGHFEGGVVLAGNPARVIGSVPKRVGFDES